MADRFEGRPAGRVGVRSVLTGAGAIKGQHLSWGRDAGGGDPIPGVQSCSGSYARRAQWPVSRR
jgi:hypothetical protein